MFSVNLLSLNQSSKTYSWSLNFWFVDETFHLNVRKTMRAQNRAMKETTYPSDQMDRIKYGDVIITN